MNKLFLTFFLSMSLFATTVFATKDTLSVSSKITKVTVFLEGAQINRQARINLGIGTYLLKLEGLPYNIKDKSFQIKTLKNSEILSVKEKLCDRKDLSKNLNTKIKDIKYRINSISDKIDVLNTEKQLLIDNSHLSKNENGNIVNTLKEAASFYRTKLNEINALIQRYQKQINLKSDSIIKVNTQMNKIASQNKPSTEIFVLVKTKAKISGHINFSYFVTSAGWTPSYDFRFENTSSPLTLNYKADIYQSSGEDWKNVKVVLSTKNPILTNELPELQKWKLNRYEEKTTTYNNQTSSYVTTLTQRSSTGSPSIKGKVVDAETGKPIAFGNVSIMEGNKVITGGMTDFDGNYMIKPVSEGTHTVRASYMGYSDITYNNVPASKNKITFLDFALSPSSEILKSVAVKEYKIPLISKDNTTSDEITLMAGRSTNDVTTYVGGVYSVDGEVGNIRGARSESTKYYVDGQESNTIFDNATAYSNNFSKLTTLEYSIQGTHTILSNGIDYTIQIQKKQITADYKLLLISVKNSNNF